MDGGRKPRVGIIVHPVSTDLSIFSLAKELVRRHNVSVTLMALRDGEDSLHPAYFPCRLCAIGYELPNSINSVHLPPISLEGIPPASQIPVYIGRLAASVRRVAKEHPLAALVGGRYDTFGIDVARLLGVPFYLFFDSSMTVLSHVTLHATDFPFPFQNPFPYWDRWVLRHYRRYREAKGILVNSFSDLEPGTASALEATGLPPVYPIGPLTSAGSTSRVAHRDKYLDLLDKQPPMSVLLISLGRTCAQLSTEQVNELTLGLRESRHSTVWVARYIRRDLLPQGFQDGVGDVGPLVPLPDPQLQLLAHKSIGAFLTDCEWYPVIKSIAHGVPFIVLPLSGEQKRNAVMLTEGFDVGVGLILNADENGLVRREEITDAISDAMSWRNIRMARHEMRMLKNSAKRALTEKGSSYKALAHVANQWKRKEHSLSDLFLFCLVFCIVSNLILSVRN